MHTHTHTHKRTRTHARTHAHTHTHTHTHNVNHSRPSASVLFLPPPPPSTPPPTPHQPVPLHPSALWIEMNGSRVSLKSLYSGALPVALAPATKERRPVGDHLVHVWNRFCRDRAQQSRSILHSTCCYVPGCRERVALYYPGSGRSNRTEVSGVSLFADCCRALLYTRTWFDRKKEKKRRVQG